MRGDIVTAKDETIAELRRRAEVAEAEAYALRLRLAETSAPPVVAVAGQDAPEAVAPRGLPPRTGALAVSARAGGR